MAGEEEAAEKKHAPSEKGWRDAIEKGQTPRSQDVSAALVLLGGALALVFASEPMGHMISSFALRMFEADAELTLASAVGLGREAMLTIILALSVPMAFIVVAGTGANLIQTRFAMAPKALEPKPERMDPFKGIKERYLSSTPLVELAKALLKLASLSAIMLWAMKDQIELLPSLAMLSNAEFMRTLKDLAWSMVISAMPIVLAIAAADYAYMYWRQYEQLKRTDKQMRDEGKEQEGDPHMRAARRNRARQIAMGQSLAKVKDADVLITNPTHYAIALRYTRGEDQAPVVLAKGVDHLALKMRAEARRHDIPRVEDRPLARALYPYAKPGQVIPEDFYGPVARILAVVFQKRAARRRG